MPGNDNSITVTDRFSDSEIMSTNMTAFATTTLSPEKASTATESSTVVYIVVGGVLFFLVIMAVVLGVIAGLLVRRVKHSIMHSIVTQPPDMKSKSSEQIPSQTDTSNFTLDILESPILEATSSEEVFKFKEAELELEGIGLASPD